MESTCNRSIRDFPLLMTTRQAADCLQITARVTKLCQRGELPGVRVGRLWRVNRDKLAEMLPGDDL